MSTISTTKTPDGKIVSNLLVPNVNNDKVITDVISPYKPSDDEKDAIQMVRHHFQLGDVNMKKPRYVTRIMSSHEPPTSLIRSVDVIPEM